VIIIKSAHEIELMREAGSIVAEVLDTLATMVQPGRTTEELDQKAESIIRGRGAVPSFKGYRGFPSTICASVNEELVHGIPSGSTILAEGDIISIDVGAIFQGFHGDSARTFPVGEISSQAQRLLDTTKRALAAGIGQARVGRRFGDISRAIQELVEADGFSVVREYTGHGIGRTMHEDPQILHYLNPRDAMRKRPLRAGMTFALEPMVNSGDWTTRVLDDGWTVVTSDGKLSAHFEHSLAISESGEPEVLTRRRE
jgi:methionyl aminopeptidase